MAVTAAPPASPAAPPAPPPKNIVIGAPRQPLRDAYHALLRLPWSVTLAVIAVGYLAVNVAFALAYWATGGVSNVHGFVDDFYFSVQTSATIGYGGMTPTTDLANTLMVGGRRRSATAA